MHARVLCLGRLHNFGDESNVINKRLEHNFNSEITLDKMSSSILSGISLPFIFFVSIKSVPSQQCIQRKRLRTITKNTNLLPKDLYYRNFNFKTNTKNSLMRI